MSLRFVPYQINDFEYCNSLLESNMKMYFDAEGIEWKKSRYEKEIVKGITRVVFHDNEKIGFIHLSERELHGYINTIQISSTSRNKGFGHEMLKWAEEQFNEMGKFAVELSVFKTSPALRLYQRIGYKIAKDRGSKYLMSKKIGRGKSH